MMDYHLPDHDFNNTWGTILAVTELQHRPIASRWMEQYWNDPLRVQLNYNKILSQYTDMFEQVLRP